MSIETVMAEHVQTGVPGLAWAADVDGTLHVGAAGNAERDTIFRIASMSKPITAVAALLLVEDGVLSLDEPIDGLVPEMADRRVMRDPQGSFDDTVPAARPITLRDLLTFRLGIGMDFTRFGQQPLLDAIVATGVFEVGPPRPQTYPPPDELIAHLGSFPLEFPPGERWLYHLGAEVLSVLLARAARQPFDELLRDRIFEPLGMRDTGFFVPPSELHRFTDCSGVDPGTGERFVFDTVDGQWTSAPAFASGGAGLVSTVDDYLAFARMLMDGGAPLLKPASVEEMTTNHLTPEQLATSSPELDGSAGWGFGCGVVVRQTGDEHVGAYGWTGGLGTSWTNDPDARVIGILLTNDMFTSPTRPTAHGDFLHAVYSGIA